MTIVNVVVYGVVFNLKNLYATSFLSVVNEEKLSSKYYVDKQDDTVILYIDYNKKSA